MKLIRFTTFFLLFLRRGFTSFSFLVAGRPRLNETFLTLPLICAIGFFFGAAVPFLMFEGVALQICGYILEKLDSSQKNDIVIGCCTMVIGFFLSLSTSAVFTWTIIASKYHTWSFILNILPYVFYFSNFGFVASKNFFKQGPFANQEFTEKAYIILSVTTKLAIFWLSLSTQLEVLQSNGFMQASQIAGMTIDWFAVRMISTVLPPSVLLFFLTVESYYVVVDPKIPPALTTSFVSAIRMGARRPRFQTPVRIRKDVSQSVLIL